MAIQGPSSVQLQQGPPTVVNANFPLTMAIWIYSTTVTGTNYFFQIQTNSSGNIGNFDAHLVFSGGFLQVGSNTSLTLAGSYDYPATGNYPTGWLHYVMTLNNDAGPGAFLNGGRIYVNGVYAPPGFANSTTMSGWTTNNAGSQINLYTGTSSGTITLAYPAVWKSILTDPQISALAAQADPRTISPSTLQSFAFLNRSSGTFPDQINGLPWVISGGSFTVVADPFPLASQSPVYGDSYLVVAPPWTIPPNLAENTPTLDPNFIAAWNSMEPMCPIQEDGDYAFKVWVASVAYRFQMATTTFVPTITGISPSSGAHSNTPVQITVTGTKFDAGAVILWNGVTIMPTTRTVTSIVFSAAAPTAGTYGVQVKNVDATTTAATNYTAT